MRITLYWMLIKFILVTTIFLIMVNTVHCLHTWNDSSVKEQPFSYETIWINNYFINASIDMRNGGIIRGYKYNNIEIVNTRYFEKYMVRNCTFYEIVPPVVQMEPWWPGSAFGRIGKLDRYDKSVYRNSIEISYDLYSPNVVLVKKYVFYYDKPWFDVEYSFTNNGAFSIVVNLSSPMYGWTRPVSFGVEISSSFAGSSGNDIKIISTKKALLAGTTQLPNLTIAIGEVRYIALLSGLNDYAVPQGVIVMPMNETIDETYSVWFEESGKNTAGAPVSNVLRIEMKAFVLPAGSSKKFHFRVYMGPLIYYYLQQLNLEVIRDKYSEATGGRVDLAAIKIPAFTPPPYKLTVSLSAADPRLYPDASIMVYKVMDNGERLVHNETPAKPFSLRDLDSGLYVIRVVPPSGLTQGGEFSFTNLTINSLARREVSIWIMKDTDVNISYALVKPARLLISFIDENYVEIKREILTNIFITVIDRYGRSYTYRASDVQTILLDPGEYEIIVNRNLGERYVTDVYINGLRVLYRADAMDGKIVCRFKLDLRNPRDYDVLIIRYGGTYLAGENPFITIFLIGIFASAGAIIAMIVLFGIRRRRV